MKVVREIKLKHNYVIKYYKDCVINNKASDT